MLLLLARKSGRFLLPVLATSSFWLGIALASGVEPSTVATSGAESKYIGAAKCKNCHGAAESGDQYGKWMSSLHAKAFETLGSDQAKKICAEKGLGDPQKADECVRCHVTAFGVPAEQIKKGFDHSQGVQCETCHGPGEAHMKARFAAAAKGEGGGAYVKVPADEIAAAPDQTKCVQCHNEQSPSYKPFCFHEFSAKIRHLNPKNPDPPPVGPCSCPKCKDGCPDSCKEAAGSK